jgi:hypothetical protein
MAVGIIVKNYAHYNRALGTYVKSKDHYDRLMKQGGYVSQEENDQRVKSSGNKPYELSKNAWDIIEAAKCSKDKKGKVNLSDKTIDAMIGIGAIKKQNIPSYMQLPSAYKI